MSVSPELNAEPRSPLSWRTMTERKSIGDDRIVVIGAGVVGAAIAYHLARAGHKVVILDGGVPADGVTAASFAWVGLAKSPAAAQLSPMRGRARAEFDRILTELSEPIGLRGYGAITWEETDELTRRFVSEHQAAGHRMELLTAEEAVAREPALRTVPDVVAYAPDDRGVDPVAYTRALLRSAQAHGAQLLANTPVTGLLVQEGRVRGIRTPTGELLSASVILAAGTASVALAATIGSHIDLSYSPSCLIRFSTNRPLVRGIISTPELEIRQLNDSTLLAAEDVPDNFTGDARELGMGALDAIRRNIVGAESVRLEHAVIADRPMPTAGHPLVGAAREEPGLYLAVAHPGIILSAEIGRQVAADHSWLRRGESSPF